MGYWINGASTTSYVYGERKIISRYINSFQID